MTQGQILRQLAEAGRLRLQDFDDAALVHLLRDELVTVAGQTVTLTDKGRRRVAPKKTTTKVAKPLHPLTPLRRNYPVGRREQPNKSGYYAAEERSRREVAEWMERHGPPPIDRSNSDPERQKELRELARLLSRRSDTTMAPNGPQTTTSASTSALTWTSPKDHCSPQNKQRTASRSGTGTATSWTTTASSSRST
jgi:hypothetical protein